MKHRIFEELSAGFELRALGVAGSEPLVAA